MDEIERSAFCGAAQIEDRLSSDQLEPLLEAKSVLDRSGPDAEPFLIRLISDNLRRYQAGKRLSRTLAILSVLILLMIVTGCTSAPSSITALPSLILFVWLSFPFLIARYDSHITCRRKLQNATTLLHQYRSLASVGVLTEAMQLGDAQTSSLATRDLEALLPQIRPEHGTLMSPLQRSYLYRALHGYNSELILPALHALELIGDAEAIPHIRRLIDSPGWFICGDRIRTEAETCLRTLQKRAMERSAFDSLLRPPSSDELSLLHPIVDRERSDPQQMLRAASGHRMPDRGGDASRSV